MGGEGEGLSSTSLKTDKKCPGFGGKNALIIFIYGLNFLFKMLFYEHLGGKKQNFSLSGLSFTSCGRNVYQSTIIPRTSPTLKVVVVPLHCIRCPKNLSSFSEQLSTSILILLSLL